MVPEGATLSKSGGWSPDSADVQLLVRGIALALARAELRQRVLEDLRDSPFENHTIELSGYLRGARGHVLTEAMASALNVSVGRVLSAAGPANGAGLTFGMPRYGDRRNWNGTENVAVAGTAKPPLEALRSARSTAGVDTHGRTVEINLHGPGPIPYLAIYPTQKPFGIDAEAKRARAPKRTGKTIGASEEQMIPFMVLPPPCDPADPNDCAPGGGGGGSTTGPGYVILPSGQTYANCLNPIVSTERINATCRAELAAAFRPRPIFEWDEACKGRKPYWAANQSNDPAGIAIFYAISYFEDCNNRSGTAGAHHGDSEFIILRVHTDPANPTHWSLANATLSAHYGMGWGLDGTWSGLASDLEFRPYESFTRPKIYVAWGKHGNFRDVGSCGRGGYYADDCGRASDTGEELGQETVADRDLGFRQAGTRRDCAELPGGMLYVPMRTSIECYWSYNAGSNFAGWTGSTDAASAYSDLLGDFNY